MTKKKVLYIGNKLSKHSNATTVIETLGLLLSLEGFQMYYASSKKNVVLRLFDMFFTTLKHIKTIDYVIIDTYSTLNFWYAVIISQVCKVFRVKYITVLHGGNLPSRLKNNPFLCDLVFKKAYKIIAPSGYLLNAFSEKYSKNLISIPNSIELKNYAFLNRNSSEPNLLWVRSFSKIYNPNMAIKVLNELTKYYPNATLCMVGPDKENLLEECKLYAENLNLNVKFTGKLSKEEWIDLSKKYNVFINTTHFDNTPVSLIEAMALGLPIVSTNVGGIPFLLQNAVSALLVNDNDEEGMVNAIKLLFIDNYLRDSLVKNSRSIAEQFDWSEVKYKWIEILK